MAAFLRRGISPSQGLYLHRTVQHRRSGHTYIHASSGIRTHNPSVRAVQDHMRLRPCDYWGRLR